MNTSASFWIAGAMISLLALHPAFADPTARYGELQGVVDAINDPDPLMRLAQLEEILTKGDATEVQLAIRTAFTVDDPNVRSLALRSHFASFRTFVVTAELPEEIKKVLAGTDKSALQSLQSSYQLRFFNDLGYHLSFMSEAPKSNELEFKTKFLNDGRSREEFNGSGNIRGGMVTIVTPIYYPNSEKSCSLEFVRYEGFTLKGMGSCNLEKGFLFPVTLHLFDEDKPPLSK
ncbi:hypothetical protein [Agrobacterium vaccinii]|uniref:hypothetical protein n=1 Tax=Agrobacterium vaccinii TaxID=2735528 RepID=UPI001E5CC19D|nr:hypothetical protein [Agrobacterium vaccinii]UHS59190.1 hypothetical protein HRS00_20400 [Agrobacterium vaccinii]